jgi:hypothetical protein
MNTQLIPNWLTCQKNQMSILAKAEVAYVLPFVKQQGTSVMRPTRPCSRPLRARDPSHFGM